MRIREARIGARVAVKTPFGVTENGQYSFGNIIDNDTNPNYTVVRWDNFNGPGSYVCINLLILIESEEHEALLVLSNLGSG